MATVNTVERKVSAEAQLNVIRPVAPLGDERLRRNCSSKAAPATQVTSRSAPQVLGPGTSKRGLFKDFWDASRGTSVTFHASFQAACDTLAITRHRQESAGTKRF